MQKKFRVLRTIATIYQFLAMLVVVAGVIIAVLSILGSTITYNYATGTVSSGPPQFGFAAGIVFVSIIIALGMFVVSEVIQVFLAIEENTRATAQAVTRLAKSRREDSN